MPSLKEDLNFVISVLESCDDVLMDMEPGDRAYWQDVLKRRDKRMHMDAIADPRKRFTVQTQE